MTHYLGEIIKQIRIRRGLTQKQLGDLSGLSEPAIRNYELGNRNPSRDKLDRIAAALDTSVYELLIPNFLFQLGEYGFTLDTLNGEPIVRVNQNAPQVKQLLLEYIEHEKNITK